MKKLLLELKQYFDRKRYEVILNDRQHLTDYEKDQLIPELKLRLNVLKGYFSEIISFCDVQKNSPVFTQAVQAIINPGGFRPDRDSPQETPAENFFNDIKRVAKEQGIDDVESMLEKYKKIENVKQLGLFINDLNNFCSALVGINNKLLLYKISAYPYLENIKTGQTVATHPPQYNITIEPFQILVTNIVGVAKATSETIHEWHKFAQKLKSQYLNLYTNRLSIKNTKLVLFIYILTIILAVSLSAFFLFANDPFNLYKENQKLKNTIQKLENENQKLKNTKKNHIMRQSSGLLPPLNGVGTSR